MPTLSEFFGIVIRMYWLDHAKPHFHAFYSGEEARFGVDPAVKLEGKFSERAARFVLEWTKLHREDLLVNWDLLSEGKSAVKIPGLK